MQFKNGCMLFSYTVAIILVLIVFLGVLFAPDSFLGSNNVDTGNSSEETVVIVDMTTANPEGLLGFIKPIMAYLVQCYIDQMDWTNDTSSEEETLLMEEIGDDSGLIFNGSASQIPVDKTEMNSTKEEQANNAITSISVAEATENETQSSVEVGLPSQASDPVRGQNATSSTPSSCQTAKPNSTSANQTNNASVNIWDKLDEFGEALIPQTAFNLSDFLNDPANEPDFDKLMYDMMQQTEQGEEQLVPIVEQIMEQVDEIMEQTFNQFNAVMNDSSKNSSKFTNQFVPPNNKSSTTYLEPTDKYSNTKSPANTTANTNSSRSGVKQKKN